MKRILLATLIIIITLTVANAEVLNVPNTIYSRGEVAKPSSFTVNITVNPTTEHIPIDAVLVIDSSPSMNRWSNVIAGGPNYYVTLATGGKGSYIGTFSINTQSDVELVLQTPNDIYNDSGTWVDQFKAYLVDNVTGLKVRRSNVNSWRWSNDPAVVRWYGLSAGTYDIYASAKGIWAATNRIMLVELPPERIEVAKSAAEYFVGLLKSYDRVAVVNFSANATTLIDLTSDKSAVNKTIDNITANVVWFTFKRRGTYTYVASATNIAAGIEEAINELDNNGRQNSVKVIILLSDGWRNIGDDPVYWASVAKSKGYRVYTIGIGGANESELRAIANAGGGEYYYASNETVLKQIYNAIYNDVKIYATNVTLTLNFINPNVTYLSYTSSIPPDNYTPTGKIVSWHWDILKDNASITVWVNSTVAGNQTVAKGCLTYTYYDVTSGKNITEGIPINVSMYFATRPTPIPTPTPTPTPPPSNESINVNYILKTIIVTYKNTTPPKDVGFKIEVDGKTIDYSNDSFILTYFRKNYTTWVLEITPQYKFTNNLTQNVTANVKFYDERGRYLNGTEFTINKTNATFYPEILNAIELNNLTIRWNGSIGYPIPLYVGEVIEIDSKLINATRGNATVNGLPINETTSGRISAIFVPNAAGEYTIEVNAINNTTTTLLLWKDVPVRIKPVTPS